MHAPAEHRLGRGSPGLEEACRPEPLVDANSFHLSVNDKGAARRKRGRLEALALSAPGERRQELNDEFPRLRGSALVGRPIELSESATLFTRSLPSVRKTRGVGRVAKVRGAPGRQVLLVTSGFHTDERGAG